MTLRVRLLAAFAYVLVLDDRGARGAARAEPVAARRRRGKSEATPGAQIVADSAAGGSGATRELQELLGPPLPSTSAAA